MNISTLPSSAYFKTQKTITFEQAIRYLDEDKIKDIESYYVEAMMFKLFEDDDYRPLKYVESIKQGVDKGSILCIIMYAILLQQGKVFQKEPIKAKKLIDQHIKDLELLAFEDNMYAQGLLGFMHTYGLFVDKNIQEAMRYYHQAIKHDFVDAYHQLGMMYLQQTPYQDKNKAHTYIKKALDAHYLPTWFAKGLEALKLRQHDEAIHYLMHASHLGHIQATFSLATIYESKREHQKAFEYFLKAANQHHVKAIYMTGLAYLNGRGVEKDEQKAYEYIQKASEHEDVLALHHLANIELKKMNPDMDRVYQNLYKASFKQHPLASHQLGLMFEEGKHMLKDVKTALHYYERGALMQFPPSLYQAAKILVDGVYVTKNISKAKHYLTLAAEKKYKPAILLLETLNEPNQKKQFTA